MPAYIKDKDTIENMDKKDMFRLLCIFMSPKDTSAKPQIDWDAAAQRYGAKNAASMSVLGNKALKKVQVDDEGDPGKAQDSAKAGNSPSKTTTGSKTEGSKQRNGSKRAAVEDTTEDLGDMGEPAAKKVKKPSGGTVKAEEGIEYCF